MSTIVHKIHIIKKVNPKYNSTKGSFIVESGLLLHARDF